MKPEPFYPGNLAAMQDRQRRREPAEITRALVKASKRSVLTVRRSKVPVTLAKVGGR